MMPKTSHHDSDKPFSRLISKEVSKPNSSCRVYYGEAAGAVPFVWESQPGTPKHKLFESSSLPPLTPPPSYSASSGRISAPKSGPVKPKFEIIVSAIFAKSRSGARARRLSQPSSIFSLSSLSTSSSSSSWSNGSGGNSRVSRNVVLFDDDDRDSGDISSSPRSGSSPTSTLCFPGMRKTARRIVAGCYAPAGPKNGRDDDH